MFLGEYNYNKNWNIKYFSVPNSKVQQFSVVTLFLKQIFQYKPVLLLIWIQVALNLTLLRNIWCIIWDQINNITFKKIPSLAQLAASPAASSIPAPGSWLSTLLSLFYCRVKLYFRRYLPSSWCSVKQNTCFTKLLTW